MNGWRSYLIAAVVGVAFAATVRVFAAAIGYPSVGGYVVQVTAFMGCIGGAAEALSLNLGRPLTIKYIDSDIYSVHGVTGARRRGLSIVLFAVSALVTSFFL